MIFDAMPKNMFNQKELFRQGLKGCPVCGEIKQIDDFSKNKGRRDGIRSVCKICINAYSRRYRKNHPEITKEYDKTYYDKNKDRCKERSIKWKKLNRDKVKAHKERFMKNNPGEFRKYEKERCDLLKDSYVRSNITAYLRRSDIPLTSSDITPDLIELRRQEMKLKRVIKQLKKQTND